MSNEKEKPLHIKVAEALGLEVHENGSVSGTVAERSYYHAFVRFDTSWEATGPLIEKYRISFACTSKSYAPRWIARENVEAEERSWIFAGGDTPLIAVCELLIDLHAAGKLPR